MKKYKQLDRAVHALDVMSELVQNHEDRFNWESDYVYEVYIKVLYAQISHLHASVTGTKLHTDTRWLLNIYNNFKKEKTNE